MTAPDTHHLKISLTTSDPPQGPLQYRSISAHTGHEVLRMSSTPIPTSTFVTESAVIPTQLSHVWHLIKLQDFSSWWSKLQGAEFIKGASPETDVVKWTFKDGTVLDVKQEEHSAIDHYITYSVIVASPALSYSSVISTIRCYPITSGTDEGQTFVTWTANFSSDADAGVIEDARFKRKEALADLAATITGK
ncbi:MAG: hypothetical protein Q9186_003316 [Xanthomendoza sp. 1 TL-2023]